MIFTWDDHKNRINIIKHGLSFNSAIKVFNDPNAVILYNDQHSNLEDRYTLIGLCDTNIIVVSFTVRTHNTYRIISARKATKSEMREYYDQ